MFNKVDVRSATNAETPVPIPIIVGVTGHRDIDLLAVELVEKTVTQVLATLKGELGSSLYVMTALAQGADQLVAKAANDLNIPIIAVLPMALDEYRNRPNNIPALDYFWDRATFRLVLPPVDLPSETAASDLDKRSFEQLGAFLCQRSHILLALWEGPERCDPRDSVNGAGGTVDVLRMKFDVQYRMKGERGSQLFERSSSWLEVPRSDPVIHVVTPRQDEGAPTRRITGYPPSGMSRSLLKFAAPALLDLNVMRRRLPVQEGI